MGRRGIKKSRRHWGFHEIRLDICVKRKRGGEKKEGERGEGAEILSLRTINSFKKRREGKRGRSG